jgi:hypothetical protein
LQGRFAYDGGADDRRGWAVPVGVNDRSLGLWENAR